MTAFAAGRCQNCGQQTLVGPLHGDNGGPTFCLPCGTDWYAKHGRRRKLGRVLIQVLKAYIDVGGEWKDLDAMKIAAMGFGVTEWEAVNISDGVGDITTELLEATVRLTHPDRHPPDRQDDARHVTQELLALKPYVFPAPPPPPQPPTAPTAPTARINQPLSERLTKALHPSFPCDVCAHTVPYFYCDPCKAEWKDRRQQERDRERVKQREQYARRKQRRQLAIGPTVCRACGQPFKGKRKDAVYCSDTCRQRGHRGRVTDKTSSHLEPPESRDAVTDKNRGHVTPAQTRDAEVQS